MEQYIPWFVGAGVVAVLGVLAFLYFRFAKGNAVATGAFTVSGSIVKTVAALLPDDVNKLDAHDVVLVAGRLFEAMPKWAADPTNVTFADVKDEITVFVNEQRVVLPVLNKLPQDVITKIAEAMFGVAKALTNK